MVSSTVIENGEASSHRKLCAAGISSGNYQIVGWDMDTTGKKVIDEICQIAGYTPSCSYSQYVMPYKNLNPPAMKRHNMKVVTIGKFRVLKDNKTNKVITVIIIFGIIINLYIKQRIIILIFDYIKFNNFLQVLKTKSEVSALTDFLTWLESVRGNAKDGVILIYHEPRKVIPAMLIESLKKYNLLERFKETVKGFANGFNIAEVKCENTVRTFSLRTLSRALLNQVRQFYFTVVTYIYRKM